jgi:hypothetical protein
VRLQQCPKSSLPDYRFGENRQHCWLDLSACPTYRGNIRRLRFDPVEAGRSGETVDVAFISAKKE